MTLCLQTIKGLQNNLLQILFLVSYTTTKKHPRHFFYIEQVIKYMLNIQLAMTTVCPKGGDKSNFFMRHTYINF